MRPKNRHSRNFIQGFFFISVLGSLFHFGYRLSGFSLWGSAFFPVNESVWEHLKLLFYPGVLWLVACLLSGRLNRFHVNDYVSSLIIGLGSIPILFYTYSGILGFHLPAIDILIFGLSIYLTLRDFYHYRKNNHLGYVTGIILLCILSFGFTVFSFSPPKIDLFSPQ